MSRRRTSHSEPSASSMNESFAYPFSTMQQQNTQPQRRGPIEGPNGRRLIRRVTWRSSTYKLMASLWVLGVFYIVWLIRDLFYLPFSPTPEVESVPLNVADDFLAQYVGRQECDISFKSLYNPPESGDERALSKSYCQTRSSLLDAMSSGGRHGFDAAYTSQGCSYRWYTTAQICDILRKFDGIAFVGDDSLASVYAGFNILLRKNLALGSLKEWEMSQEQGEMCKCNSQFTSSSCASLRISSSDEIHAQDGKPATQSPYACSTQTLHAFLAATESPALKNSHERFRQLIRQAGQKKPIPIIHSLSLSTSLSVPTAKSSMDEWITLAQATGRDMPFLWVGPTAPGHQKVDGQNSPHANSAVWQYTMDTAEAAQIRDMDVLGMYNATLQAESWDGMHYGEKVALMQAMMVINWLSTLE
ncbi:hypothetical protein ASPWEDRAFT_658676 [Aspergillus wentii DTO 134E9]|uniref:Uncharacterized protein n=1 Tax=Aspergillus wentii DTO 134E9 TaxID=1073089 RepID=A0A1L9RBS5_ASPWE|nr:uncharacterized protein ASPWEDRAFT_658676 [Aspergillus wentii DTO 134E9]OJJ32327.1 hypothetical protein ASPWEDRAFT_658676 [Aspergillus wentii DTO 134E9]